MIKKFCDFLLEYVDYNKVYDIAVGLDEYMSYDNMFVLRDVDNPKIYNVEDGRLILSNKKIYNQDVLIRNYKTYFGNIDLIKSEIIKIEFEGYNWITVFLAYGRYENYSVVSYSPDFNYYDLIKIVNDYLDSKNFKTIKNPLINKNVSNAFLSKLIQIFRDISGRGYSKNILPEIKKEFINFKKNNLSEWNLYERWKYKNLGKSLKCVRFMDLPANMKVQLINGDEKSIKDLTDVDRFYYPISNRDFSQWAEIGDDSIENIKNDLHNILSSTVFGVVSDIPTKKIIFTNKIMMYNFSPNVYEREVVVEHDILQKYDENIICKIC